VTSAPDGVVASVIVCTHNRATMLDGCLRSILADSSLVRRELIVVDNGSSDETEAVVRATEAIRAEMPVRYVMQPRIGKAHALNRAVEVAQGEFLLFTDDDILVEDGWADALVDGFSDPAVGAVCGRVLPRWPFPPPPWMNGPHAERLTLPDFGPEPRLLDPSKPVGANMALRARVARMFDPPFNPNLGPSGQLHIDHEECHLLRRIAADHLLGYQPEALVFHRIPSERMEWISMRRCFFQGGFGLVRSGRLEGSHSLPLAVRVVRAFRTCRAAWRIRRRNERKASRGPDDATEEFSDYAWAGVHLELLFGRFPRVADWIATHLV
jgi:glycosyltransferase involved in cell wall biosynthesis